MLGFRREKKSIPDDEGESMIPPASGAAGAQAGPSTKNPAKRLGEILIDEGLIGAAQLDEALAKQAEEGGFIGEVMVRLGFVKQDAIVSCLVKQCKIPHLNLLDYEVTKEVLQIIPKELCLKHNLLPIDRLGRILTIAMVNPFDVNALEEIRRVCPELRIKPILCDWEHFRTVIGRVFGDSDDRPKPANDAASFGLRPLPSAPPPASKPKVEPNAEGVPAPETEAAMAATVSSLLQDAVEHAGREIPSGAQAAKSPPPVGEQRLSAVVRESVGGAIQEAMATLMVESRSAEAKRGAEKPVVGGEDIAAAVRQEMKDALGSAIAEIRDIAHTSAPSSSAEDIAETIRQTVGTAMQEVLAQVVVQMKSSFAAAPHPEQPDLSGLNEMVRSTVREALRESEEASGHVKPVDVEGRDLDEMVRSSVRDALRESEEAAVARMNRRDLEARDAERLRRQKHTSVVSFGTQSKPVQGQVANPEIRIESDERLLSAMRSDRLLTGFTFDEFCVGKANAFTFKLCEAVSTSPGGEYNPFFLYGDVGLGKTHLINAVGNSILARDHDGRVGYVSASRFASRLGEAARDDALDAFRANYCHWDVLILDDIQFLGGRIEAQEEFFHIFNVFQQEGRQIIIAGDKSPDRLGMLEQRLVSRFAGGIVVNLRPPEWETRVAILHRHVARTGIKVSDEIVSLIAVRVPNDVRKMIGALKKVVAYAELVNEPISCEMANDILTHLGIEEAA